mgnify:CR=1 FL=1
MLLLALLCVPAWGCCWSLGWLALDWLPKICLWEGTCVLDRSMVSGSMLKEGRGSTNDVVEAAADLVWGAEAKVDGYAWLPRVFVCDAC